MDDSNDMVYVYVLAPITAILAVAVITYITVQSRRLRQEMLESGQLVSVLPAVITIQNPLQRTSQQQANIRSPDGLPPPPAYSKY